MYLHDVEKTLLTNAILIFEQIVTGKRPSDVTTDGFLEGRRLLQIR